MTTNSSWTGAMLERVLLDAAAIAPDAEVIERDGWMQLVTPSRPEVGRNGVFVSRLEPAQVDDRIAEVTRYYRERGAGFRWIVGPSSAPEELSERLVRAGIPILSAALGMHMRVPTQIPELPSTLEFQAVELGNLDAYIDVSMRGWERTPEFRAELDTLSRLMLAGVGPQSAWLIYEDGVAVASSVLSVLPGVGYFQGAAVLPERRRHGIYVALIHHRLALLRRLGIEHAVIWASETTSAGVCRRAGFVPLCRAVFHELPRPQP
jgi:GNAT superfamily N-acetyltransferase